MRFIYSVFFYLATPLIMLRLLWRSRRLPAYRRRMLERFGFYPKPLPHSIWVHAVSVGEVLAAIPLIKALQKRYPQQPLVVTTMTPTGGAQVRSVFGEDVTHYYLPYDLPCAVARFMRAIQPRIAIIMETEIWPNLLAACSKRNIPTFLLNARLSAKSAAGYGRIASLAREALQHFTKIAAHGQQDADRFIALGAKSESVVVTGNIKFDLTIPVGLEEIAHTIRREIGHDRFVWIAASTHAGEEEIVLQAHQLLRAEDPHALLILVPRHPDRFEAVAKLAAQQFSVARRSLQEICEEKTAVYLGDTMGELLLLYGAADVAFIGGSLVAKGGHNMLEPGALGKPLIIGPSMYNFSEISKLFLQAQAMIKIVDGAALAQALLQLKRDAHQRTTMGERALQVVQANGGALQKQLELIFPVLDR